MLAFIAPGQGAQTPGMLEPWLSDPSAKELVAHWSTQIDLDLLRLGTTAGADEIKDTANAQPLIVAAGLLGARALGSAKIAIVAGHSVGEITAAAKLLPLHLPECLQSLAEIVKLFCVRSLIWGWLRQMTMARDRSLPLEI